MKNIIMTLMMLIILIGCGNNSTSPSNTNSPFSLQQLGSALRKPTSEITVVSSMDEQVYEFDLDTVATTSSFQFIPNNTGNSNITGIKLSFDNPKFIVSPDTITILNTPDQEVGITPLIKVTVVHGKDALGIGYDDMLSANQYGTLTVTGENADGKFSVDYTMHVYAKRMVITVKFDSLWVQNEVSLGDSDLVALLYAEIDSNSTGCYIDVEDEIITSSTHMIRHDDLPTHMNMDTYIKASESDIGTWSVNRQNTAIGSLVNDYNTVRSRPISNCPTYVKLYDGSFYVIPY